MKTPFLRWRRSLRVYSVLGSRRTPSTRRCVSVTRSRERHGLFPCSRCLCPEFWQSNYADGKFFKDRIVLLERPRSACTTFYLTPWGKLSGPEINLHAMAAMLRESWLTQGGLLATVIGIVWRHWRRWL